jgi:hypothetical protein
LPFGQLGLRYVLVPESGTLARVRCPFFSTACFGCQIFGLLRARRLVFLARSFFAAGFTRNNFYALAAVFLFAGSAPRSFFRMPRCHLSCHYYLTVESGTNSSASLKSDASTDGANSFASMVKARETRERRAHRWFERLPGDGEGGESC